MLIELHKNYDNMHAEVVQNRQAVQLYNEAIE